MHILSEIKIFLISWALSDIHYFFYWEALVRKMTCQSHFDWNNTTFFFEDLHVYVLDGSFLSSIFKWIFFPLGPIIKWCFTAVDFLLDFDDVKKELNSITYGGTRFWGFYQIMLDFCYLRFEWMNVIRYCVLQYLWWWIYFIYVFWINENVNFKLKY